MIETKLGHNPAPPFLLPIACLCVMSCAATTPAPAQQAGVDFSTNGVNLLATPEKSFPKAAATKGDGVLRMRMGDPVLANPGKKGSLHPYLGDMRPLNELLRYTSNRLACRHLDDLDVRCQELAVSVKTNDRGLSYVIELRKGVRWRPPQGEAAEPREFTAADYLAAFAFIQDSSVRGRAGYLRPYFKYLKRVEPIDSHRFKVVFSERRHLNLPSVLDMEPVPHWAPVKSDPWWKTWTIGPYWISEVRSDGYRLRRNEQYWGLKPAFSEVAMLALKDPDAWKRFEAGELDIVNMFYWPHYAQVRASTVAPSRTPQLHTATIISSIAWNCARAPLDDVRVRRALTLALDRPGMIKNTLHGLGVPLSAPFPHEMRSYDSSIKPLPFDPAEASRLLSQAGLEDRDGDGIREDASGKPVVLDIVATEPWHFDVILPKFQKELRSVGIQLNYSFVDYGTLTGRLAKGQFHGHAHSLVLYWDLDLDFFWASDITKNPRSDNPIGYQNPALDPLLEDFSKAMDRESRVIYAHKFHKIFHEDQPHTVLYQHVHPVYRKSSIAPLTFSLVWPLRDLLFVTPSSGPEGQ